MVNSVNGQTDRYISLSILAVEHTERNRWHTTAFIIF